jgi:exodeoxyribonuclease VII large subunit
MIAVMESKPAPAASNLSEYTVGELSQRLKRTVEDAYALVRVRGEISGFKRATSGHLYLALKDADAVLDAVCWKGTAGRLGLKPEDGMEVVVTGKLTTFPGRSKYQMVIERMELAGLGALMALLEQRRKKLEAEGLFDPARKKPIPYIPDVIGVVTSPTGAVIRDILHRLRDRFPRHVIVWPVRVQGEGAAEEVAAAIRGFNAIAPGGPVPRPDVLIVARGGGSLEDLWAFNEEVVVRAAAASDIPLISAVGHETDTTLIDFASDRRAPTPTAAAEMAVPVRLDLIEQVGGFNRRLIASMRRRFAESTRHLTALGRGLRDPRERIQELAQRLDDLDARLKRAPAAAIERKRVDLAASAAALRPTLLRREVADLKRGVGERAGRLERALRQRLAVLQRELDGAAKLLETLSYKSILGRGYAVVRGPDGHPVTRAEAVAPGLAASVEFADGRRDAVFGAGPGPRPRRATPPKDQGSLL